MGLFIGASILTILELFDYAYEVSLNSLIHVRFQLEPFQESTVQVVPVQQE